MFISQLLPIPQTLTLIHKTQIIEQIVNFTIMPFLRLKEKLLQALTFSKILLISWGYYWVLKKPL